MTPPNPRSVKAAKLVLAAIQELRGKDTSIESISEYIEDKFSVPNKDFCKYLDKALEKGIAFGAIKKMRGRYYLGDVMRYTRSHRRRRRSKHGKKGGRRRRRRSHH